MKTLSLLILACLGPLSFGAELIDYDASIQFARERADERIIPAENTIFCLGPEQIEETYVVDGREDKKIARFSRLFDSERFKTAGVLLSRINLMGNAFYEVCIYRSDSKKLTVRITGETSELQRAQFALKRGDLVVIQRRTEGR